MANWYLKKLSTEYIISLIRKKDGVFWSKVREERALQVFRLAAARVPAYKDFLKKHKVNPDKIRTFKDFALVPPVNKKNYLRKYPLEKLILDGSLKRPIVFTATSGSTGEPFYFPRSSQLDWASSVLHEFFLRNSIGNSPGPTLVIVCFGMGVWIGGLITYKAFEIASRYHVLPLSILTPGVNKKEIFDAIKHIAPKFKEVVLCGYPPFIKDIVDEAKDYDVHLKKINLRIVFAAEAFSEKFRDYIVREAGIKNLYTDMMNIYGSADLGSMAAETPLSILARRRALRDDALLQELFRGVSRLPTFTQFNPFFINFESVDQNILCTASNALPLVRYDIGDYGSVFDYGAVTQIFKSHRIDLAKEAKKLHLEHTLSQLPFVAVYERKDMSTKLYGAIMYPEHIREALHHSHVHRLITGKFTMVTQNDKHHNEYLEVHIELKPRVKYSRELRERVYGVIVDELLKKNAEYRYLFGLTPDRVKPRIIFWPHEHPSHFKPGAKQRWVKTE